MLWTITIMLVLLWVIGVSSSYTLAGWIHVLLLLAIAAVAINLIRGRTPV